MAIRKDEVEAKALKLSPEERAELAHRLIESLEGPGRGDFEVEWIEAAERRYAEYRKGLVAGRPAEEVLRKAKARLE